MRFHSSKKSYENDIAFKNEVIKKKTGTRTYKKQDIIVAIKNSGLRREIPVIRKG